MLLSAAFETLVCPAFSRVNTYSWVPTVLEIKSKIHLRSFKRSFAPTRSCGRVLQCSIFSWK